MSTETQAEPPGLFQPCLACGRAEGHYLTYTEMFERCHAKRPVSLENARVFWACNQCGVTDVRRSETRTAEGENGSATALEPRKSATFDTLREDFARLGIPFHAMTQGNLLKRIEVGPELEGSGPFVRFVFDPTDGRFVRMEFFDGR